MIRQMTFRLSPSEGFSYVYSMLPGRSRLLTSATIDHGGWFSVISVATIGSNSLSARDQSMMENQLSRTKSGPPIVMTLCLWVIGYVSIMACQFPTVLLLSTSWRYTMQDEVILASDRSMRPTESHGCLYLFILILVRRNSNISSRKTRIKQ